MSLQREILLPVTTAGLLLDNRLFPTPTKSCLTYACLADCYAESLSLNMTNRQYGGERVISENNTIECQLCHRKMKGVTNSHLLLKHSITLDEYKKTFPSVKMWAIRNHPWNRGLTIQTDERMKKCHEAMVLGTLRKYGVKNSAQIPGFAEKHKQTTIKNGTTGLGKPKPGTSEKLKGKPKSEVHRQHISEAVKLQYRVNPERRDISRRAGRKSIRKLFTQGLGIGKVFEPQKKLFKKVKQYFPNAKLEYRVRISNRKSRYLDVAVPEYKIDFEYDGKIHKISQVCIKNDKERDSELSVLGWKIIRINKDNFDNLDSIIYANFPAKSFFQPYVLTASNSVTFPKQSGSPGAVVDEVAEGAEIS